MDKQAYIDRLTQLHDSFLQSKRDLLDEYLATNRKYPDRMTFPFHDQTATITSAFVRDRDMSIQYICYVPNWCDFPILHDEPIGDRSDSGVQLAEKIIDRILGVD